MRRRVLPWALLLAAAISLPGCEEGEFVDLPPSGGATRDISLVLVTATPVAGSTFDVRATVTDDGEPAGGVTVAFSGVNSLQTIRPCNPSTVNTASVGAGLIGTATTQCSSSVGDTRITVTASTTNPTASATVNVNF